MSKCGVDLKTYVKLLESVERRVKVITKDRCLEGNLSSVEGYAEGVLFVKVHSIRIFVPISIIDRIYFE